MFLTPSMLFNIADSYGVEVIHPIREGRSEQSKAVSRKGKSNKRWIVGRKVNVVLNRNGITAWEQSTANICDKDFNPCNASVKGIVLADSGYRDQNGTPQNIKICARGTWNDRMFVETLFSLWHRICHAKYGFVRSVKAFATKYAFLVMLTNIVFSLNQKYNFYTNSFVQWEL